MIIIIPSKTKEKLNNLSIGIDKLIAVKQSIYDTLCDVNNYSGKINFTEEGDIITEDTLPSDTELLTEPEKVNTPLP